MSAETLLRLALVPFAVWLASLAARRWGHTVSGYLGGMPMIGGPITLFLALDLGPAFAAKSSLYTVGAVLGQGAHLLAMGRVGQHRSWFAALAAGWTSFLAVSLATSLLPLTPWTALPLAIAGLMGAWIGLPRPRDVQGLPSIPPTELRLRLVAAFTLAGFIIWSAPVFGPVVSGVLLSMPVTGSITPPFTLALYGAGALARLLRGFVVGLSGFVAFFFTLSIALVPWGTAPAFAAAVLAALVAVGAVERIARRA